MGARDTRIDTYISSSADFARPILTYLRDLIHEACPDVEETMKWSRPHFLYKGMLCAISAFKEHCCLASGIGARHRKRHGRQRKRNGSVWTDHPALGSPLQKGSHRVRPRGDETERCWGEIPLADAGESRPRRSWSFPTIWPVRTGGNPRAHATFENFSTSKKREYVEWLTEAKTPATRARRLETAVEWIAEGKSRNWKYSNC